MASLDQITRFAMLRAFFSQPSGNSFVAEPFFAHGFPHQRADPRRVGSAPNRDQINLSPELRFNDGQRDYARMLDCICGHEGESQTGCDHGHGPIVAFAPICRSAGYALLLKNVVGVTGEFAVHTMYVTLPIQFLDWKSTLICEPMVAMNGNDHLLTKERHNVSSIIDFFAWQCIDHGLKITGKQALPQVPGVGIAKS